MIGRRSFLKRAALAVTALFVAPVAVEAVVPWYRKQYEFSKTTLLENVTVFPPEPFVLTKENLYESGRVLDEQHVPTEGRWISYMDKNGEVVTEQIT